MKRKDPNEMNLEELIHAIQVTKEVVQRGIFPKFWYEYVDGYLFDDDELEFNNEHVRAAGSEPIVL